MRLPRKLGAAAATGALALSMTACGTGGVDEVSTVDEATLRSTLAVSADMDSTWSLGGQEDPDTPSLKDAYKAYTDCVKVRSALIDPKAANRVVGNNFSKESESGSFYLSSAAAESSSPFTDLSELRANPRCYMKYVTARLVVNAYLTLIEVHAKAITEGIPNGVVAVRVTGSIGDGGAAIDFDHVLLAAASSRITAMYQLGALNDKLDDAEIACLAELLATRMNAAATPAV